MQRLLEEEGHSPPEEHVHTSVKENWKEGVYMPRFLPAAVPLDPVGPVDTSLPEAVLGHRIWSHHGAGRDVQTETPGSWGTEEWNVVPSEGVQRDRLESSQKVVNVGEEGGGG